MINESVDPPGATVATCAFDEEAVHEPLYFCSLIVTACDCPTGSSTLLGVMVMIRRTNTAMFRLWSSFSIGNHTLPSGPAPIEGVRLIALGGYPRCVNVCVLMLK